MAVQRETAFRALNMYAQGMDGRFVQQTLNLSNQGIRDVSDWLREEFQTGNLAGAVGAAYRKKLFPVKPFPTDAWLSPRQTEVLYFMSLGYSDERIALEMGVTFNTMRRHAGAMMDKFGVSKRAHVVALGFQYGFLIP